MIRFLLTFLLLATIHGSAVAQSEELFDDNISFLFSGFSSPTGLNTYNLISQKPIRSLNFSFVPFEPVESPEFLLDLSNAESGMAVISPTAGPKGPSLSFQLVDVVFAPGFEPVGQIELLRLQPTSVIVNFDVSFSGTFSDGQQFASAFAAIPEPNGVFLAFAIFAGLGCVRSRPCI